MAEGIDYTEFADDYTQDTQDNGSDYNNVSMAALTFTNKKSILTSTLVAINILICGIGLGGNALVIWVCGWKMKRNLNTTWYLSLAISDFSFSACLTLDIVYSLTSHWPFGLVLCKITSFALFFNMFSSVFLLVLISADRCAIVMFPVWSQNHRTIRKARAMVVLMWVLSALLTLPALIYRQTKVHGPVTQCYTDYVSVSKHRAVVWTRFSCGFLIPILVIVFCCSALCIRLKSLTIKSTKPYKVMAALILSFFVCWVPYHTFVLIEFNKSIHHLDVIETGLKVGGTMAAANSFMNPLLYVLIGNDIQRTLKRTLMSRIENAMADEFRTGGHNTSRSKSIEIMSKA